VPAVVPAVPEAPPVGPVPDLPLPADQPVELTPTKVALALGVPPLLLGPESVARTGTGALRDTLADALRRVGAPPRPPTHPGALIVVVGEAHVRPTADAVAKLIDVAPDDVLVARFEGAADIDGPKAAEWRAPGLHAGDHPKVVAVEAPLDGTGPRWARSVTEALRPSAVWAVVDATRKVTDIGDYLRALGCVDAIALYRAVASRDPAAVFDLPVPVAMVDGVSATAPVWVDLLWEKARALLGL
jgi:hypothetical protein